MLKQIYSNSLGEQIEIKETGGNCIIFVKDQDGDEAEICIPNEFAIDVAHKIIDECKWK